jgi:hypothetical protein
VIDDTLEKLTEERRHTPVLAEASKKEGGADPTE